MRPLLIFFGVCLLPVLGGAAYFYFTTFSTPEHEARAAVLEHEQPWLEKFDRLQPGMTPEEVRAILGEPDRGSLASRPTWRVAGSASSQIAVTFTNNRATRIRWLAIGRFLLEK
jgi:hypothetical protein